MLTPTQRQAIADAGINPDEIWEPGVGIRADMPVVVDGMAVVKADLNDHFPSAKDLPELKGAVIEVTPGLSRG
ncbi:MAG: hypothetical protein LBK95_13915 [Bifidobacteriaceae bacterium]|nr:hypothetical protein [Bifidobacteriaceae bacterium]